MDSQIKTILDITELWEETLVIIATSTDGKFLVWAERKDDHVQVISTRLFDSEAEARTSFKFLCDILLELTNPVAKPRMLSQKEVTELGDSDILQAIDQNPMDDDGLIIVVGDEQGHPFIANFKRGFRDAEKSYYPTMESARSEFLEIWNLVNRQYNESH